MCMSLVSYRNSHFKLCISISLLHNIQHVHMPIVILNVTEITELHLEITNSRI